MKAVLFLGVCLALVFIADVTLTVLFGKWWR